MLPGVLFLVNKDYHYRHTDRHTAESITTGGKDMCDEVYEVQDNLVLSGKS